MFLCAWYNLTVLLIWVRLNPTLGKIQEVSALQAPTLQWGHLLVPPKSSLLQVFHYDSESLKQSMYQIQLRVLRESERCQETKTSEE